MEILWKGRATTDLQLLTYEGIRQAVKEAQEAGLSVPEIAQHLAKHGVVWRRGPQAGKRYDERDVTRLISSIVKERLKGPTRPSDTPPPGDG